MRLCKYWVRSLISYIHSLTQPIVFIYIHYHIEAYTRARTHIRSHKHICTSARTHAHTHTHTHIYIYIYTQTHTLIYTQTHTHLYTCMCVCMYCIWTTHVYASQPSQIRLFWASTCWPIYNYFIALFAVRGCHVYYAILDNYM